MNEFNESENIMDIPVAPPVEDLPPVSSPITEGLNENVENSEIEASNTQPQNNINYNVSSESHSLGNLNPNNEVIPIENETVENQTTTAIDNNKIPESITENNVQETNAIPETMDLSYGVIPPNNSETIIKEKSSNKSTKIVIGVIVGIVLISLLIIGFLAYKFYFAIDPVKEVTTRIRKAGKNLDKTYGNSANIDFIINNDKINYNGKTTVTADIAGEKYDMDFGYGMILLKSDNKANANVYAKYNNKDLLKLDATFFKSALFIKVLEEGRNYKTNVNENDFFSNLETEINKMASVQTFTNLSDYLAKAIEKNISKKDFEISTEKTDINGKNVIANKYNITLKSEDVANIFSDFINFLANDDTLGFDASLLNDNFDANSIVGTDYVSNIEINVYASLKGIIKAEIVPKENGPKITYLKIDNDHKVLIIESDESNTIKSDIYTKADKTIIETAMNIDGTDVNLKIEFDQKGNLNATLTSLVMTVSLEGTVAKTEENKKLANETTINLKISMPGYLPSDIVINVTSNMTMETNDELTVSMPSGAINIETTEGQALFESEFKQTGLYSLLEQFLVSDNLMDSSYENADEFDSYEDYTYLNDTI